MNYRTAWSAFLGALITCGVVCAQQGPETAGSTTTACTFEDGKQISVRHQKRVSKGNPPTGKLWMPGKKPLYLFTPAEISIGEAVLTAGAYSMYLIPEKENWTLVINRNVSTGSPYDEKEDAVRVPLQLGQSSDSQPFKVVFGHVGPKQCNLRFYLGKIGTWAEFREK